MVRACGRCRSAQQQRGERGAGKSGKREREDAARWRCALRRGGVLLGLMTERGLFILFLARESKSSYAMPCAVKP